MRKDGGRKREERILRKSGSKREENEKKFQAGRNGGSEEIRC